uniref:Integrase core domain-containing protein n=1 Tax=Astyanax mexicanus TaxID=7994 RepID=A0A8B9H5Z3_ASTMX
MPTEMLQALRDLFRFVTINIECISERNRYVERIPGQMGRPKLDIERESLEELLETDLPVPCLAKMRGVSMSTLFRRMREFGLSARRYSNMSDEELDRMVQDVKNEMPMAGYRMVKGRLRSLGVHVQWRRVAASLHRVDSLGIISRLAGLGCVVRRTYSVRGPLSLWHVDTNHNLIRYNIVLFGAVDGFSRKVMCLSVATNNLASTAFAAFKEATEKHGIPSRIEHLWLDVKTCVTSKYYNILQSLEREQLLDVCSSEDLFAVHAVFLPKLRKDLESFVDGWNNHPIRTESNMTPEQLWHCGIKEISIDQPENVEDLEEPDIDWDIATNHDGEMDGEIVVPQIESHLNEGQIQVVQSLIEQSDPDMPARCLYLTCRKHIFGTG